ncbi:MAG: VWA domain-containing protein [Acidobacteriota bacterium]|nr:VWA domain-containing protein [Acidobacteriota bacterium]
MPVNVVLVKVIATDEAGNPVTDLKASDFRIYDDEKPQKIQTFAVEMQENGEPEDEEAPIIAPKAEKGKVAAPTSRARMVSIVIDDLTAYSTLDYGRIVEAAKKYVQDNMRSGDQVAVLSGSRFVRIPFSGNKGHLLRELDTATGRLNLDIIQANIPSLTDLEAQTIAEAIKAGRQPNSPYLLNLLGIDITKPGAMSGNSIITGIRKEGGMAFNSWEAFVRQSCLAHNADMEFRTHSLLQTMRQHIRALRQIEGARSIVLFSDGFLSTKNTTAAYQLQEVINLALKSGIVIHAIGTRGVLSGWDGETPGGKPVWNLLIAQDDKRAQEETLAQIASDTGGLFSNGNDMNEAFRRAFRYQPSYYIMSYNLPSRKADGTFHTIRVESTRPGIKLSYRKGYYTQQEQLAVENRKAEDIVAALDAPGNMDQIPISLSYNYSQSDASNYAVSFMTNVDIRRLQFSKEDDRRQNAVSLILAAYDENDRYISGVEKSIEFQLLEESYAELRGRGFRSRVEIMLPVGRYRIKAVVRESNEGKMGSATRVVDIP